MTTLKNKRRRRLAPRRAIDRLRCRTADACRPRKRIPPDVWVERFVKLSDLEAGRGRYDLTQRPWWREILRAAADPETQEIAVVASTQVGKTLWLCCLCLYLAENSPASALVVLPDQTAATEFRDRLYALAAASGLRIPPLSRWNMRHCDVAGMRIYLAWAGSRQRLRGRRCKYVFLSEIDVYPTNEAHGDPVDAARQRVKAFPRHLILAESSPVPNASRIDQIESDCNRLRWVACCPHCGLEQSPRFFRHTEGEHAGRGGIDGLQVEGEWIDADAALSAAFYRCRAGCQIDNADKGRFIESGRWQSITPARSRRRLGYHLWAVHSPATWGKIAAEYLIARAHFSLPEFFQHELGLSHKPTTTLPTWRQLGERLATAAHTRGEVPPDAWFLTASCDVQEREVYCVVRAWGDARTSWLVDWFVFDRREGDDNELIKSDLAQLTADVIGRQWPTVGAVANPLGRRRLGIALAGIDAKYRTIDVHHWLRSLSPRGVARAVQGDGNLHDVRYKASTVYESRRKGKDGKTTQYEGGLELWSINSTAFRLDLVGLFKAATDKPGAWLLPADVFRGGAFYLKQLVNEPPTYERSKKDGRKKLIFKERDAGIGHDFWDCEVNGLALAQMYVDRLKGAPGWDATRWAKLFAAPAVDPGAIAAEAPDRQQRAPHAARDYPRGDRSAR